MARTYREERTYLTREESRVLKHGKVRFEKRRKQRFKELLCDMRRGVEGPPADQARH